VGHAPAFWDGGVGWWQWTAASMWAPSVGGSGAAGQRQFHAPFWARPCGVSFEATVGPRRTLRGHQDGVDALRDQELHDGVSPLLDSSRLLVMPWRWSPGPIGTLS